MHVQLDTRLTRGLTAAVLAFAALTACSKKEKVSGGDVTTGAAAAPTPAASTVAVADIDVGRAVANAKVTDKTNDFKATDTVYASVHTTGTSPAATVMARWTFEDGQVVNESSQSIAPNGDAYTEFHISKPSGLPKGKYKVEVFLDTKSAGSKDFEIK
jgi:hypothetical protein